MSELKNIPIIDLFAGPGGLGEGFSSLFDNNNERTFDIRLSIEKDQHAHKTLELRSFFRQFKKGEAPEAYYDVLRAKSIKEREQKKLELFEKYPGEYTEAKNEAWQAELGSDDFPSELIDKRIRKKLNNVKDWVLIGGPPCQAYSLAGRSRVGGIDEEDHRVYLYKEYLRIIAVHHPAVFVMENVKGLLSAKVNGEKVFDWMQRDLQNPASVFEGIKSPKYRVYSLIKKSENVDFPNEPQTLDGKSYLIKSEKYGVPQKRHRVILLGIREDIEIIPRTLKEEKQVPLKNVIGDLPKLRSGISRSYASHEMIDGKKKRFYKVEQDSDEKWETIVNAFRKEVISLNGFDKELINEDFLTPSEKTGSEFVVCNTPLSSNPLYDWYLDEKLDGVANHFSRSHLVQDLKRYLFSSLHAKVYNRFPRLHEFEKHSSALLPDHKNAKSGKFSDRFRVQLSNEPATTVTSHISKDGHYFIHYDPSQCRSLTVREAARIQTFPDNYLFCGSRTAQYHQVGNAVPPYLAKQIAEIVYDIIKENQYGEEK